MSWANLEGNCAHICAQMTPDTDNIVADTTPIQPWQRQCCINAILGTARTDVLSVTREDLQENVTGKDL